MEFERALFRVYERAIILVYSPSPTGWLTRRGCAKCCELVLLVAACAVTLVLAMAHVSYYGDAGCLPHAFAQDLPAANVTLNQTDLVFAVTVVSDSSALATEVAQYRMAFIPALTVLNDDLLRGHGFPIVNITLPMSCSAAPGSWLWPILDTDPIVINNWMASTPQPTYMINMDTGEAFAWGMPPDNSITNWIASRIGAVAMSALSFVYASAISAFLARALLTTGVVILVPLLYTVYYLGILRHHPVDAMQTYPWVGMHLQALRTQGKSVVSFVVSQSLCLLFYYLLYEASQLAWSFTVYTKSNPAGLNIFVFTLVLLWEYFSMMMCRSVVSIRIFPRVTILAYLLFHIFFYVVRYSFFMLAAYAMALYTFWVMVYLLRTAEYAAVTTGAVSHDNPRALITQLPYAVVGPASTPDFWTLFYPLNSRVVPVTQMPVPPMPAGQAPQAALPADSGSGEASGAVTVQLEPESDTTATGNTRPRARSELHEQLL